MGRDVSADISIGIQDGDTNADTNRMLFLRLSGMLRLNVLFDTLRLPEHRPLKGTPNPEARNHMACRGF